MLKELLPKVQGWFLLLPRCSNHWRRFEATPPFKSRDFPCESSKFFPKKQTRFLWRIFLGLLLGYSLGCCFFSGDFPAGQWFQTRFVFNSKKIQHQKNSSSAFFSSRVSLNRRFGHYNLPSLIGFLNICPEFIFI